MNGQIPHCTSAKIGVSESKGMYVICVTTADYTNLADVKQSYDELSALGLLQECESGYRIECQQYTGMCASHDGDSRSATRNSMELNVYRTDNIKDDESISKLQEILQKGSFNPQAAGMCRHYSRNSCRFKGNCWSVHSSQESPLLAGGGAAGGAAGGGGFGAAPAAGGAVGAPTTMYTLPAAGVQGHAAPVTAITIAVDKNWVISGAEDGSVIVWDLSTCVSTTRTPHHNLARLGC